MQATDPYTEAQKRVKKKKEFYSHLSSYVVMGIFFFVLNFLTAPGRWWFYWPMLGWGIGLAFHYIDVFGIPGVGDLSKDWEEKAIEEELQKMGVDDEEKYLDPPAREELELKELKKTKKKNWDDDELV
jgi:hypothetical protein